MNAALRETATSPQDAWDNPMGT
ncbi:MAG: hypothetical protein QG643_2512, partial [Pseudomonadota bacterium]|nr:hypothetical protein [Pseudomonadota bacterium]